LNKNLAYKKSYVNKKTMKSWLISHAPARKD